MAGEKFKLMQTFYVDFKDIFCSIKGFNYDYQCYQYLSWMHLWAASELANQETMWLPLFLFCMFPSFMPLIFDAKLHIEICFQKIIQNTHCSHSVMLYAFALWDFQGVEHSQNICFPYLTKCHRCHFPPSLTFPSWCFSFYSFEMVDVR